MYTEQMIGNYKTEIKSQDLKVAWVRMDISLDGNSFHNFTVLGKNECRWAEVLYMYITTNSKTHSLRNIHVYQKLSTGGGCQGTKIS